MKRTSLCILLVLTSCLLWNSVSGLACYTCYWTEDPEQQSLPGCRRGNLTTAHIGYFEDSLVLPNATGFTVKQEKFYSYCAAINGTFLESYKFVHRFRYPLRDEHAKSGCEKISKDKVRAEWTYLYGVGALNMSPEALDAIIDPTICYCDHDGCNLDMMLGPL